MREAAEDFTPGSLGRPKRAFSPGIDHHSTRYPSPEDAFADRAGKPAASPAMAVLIPWLKRVTPIQEGAVPKISRLEADESERDGLRPCS